VDYLTDEQRSYGDKEPLELGADLQSGLLVAQILASSINKLDSGGDEKIREAELLQRIRLTVAPEAELGEYYRLSVLRQAE
jgi:hypothetical protein